MRELSLNILDIVENSVKAGASLAEIDIILKDGMLTIKITDDGCGMDADFLARVTDPYTTTRTTRKVGMGLPLLKMEAEQAGGKLEITSEKGVGTTVVAVFEKDHIDRPPLGDIADTMVTLLSDDYATEYLLRMNLDGEEFDFDTRELKAQLGGMSVAAPEILMFVREMITENSNAIGGAKL
jgi:anti-sigma regulatory factor (Ser/Thr protein kinase)